MVAVRSKRCQKAVPLGPPWSPIGPYRIIDICVGVHACADRVLQAVLFIDVAYVMGGRVGVDSAFFCRLDINLTPPPHPHPHHPSLPWLGWLACCALPWLGLAWACLARLASNNNSDGAAAAGRRRRPVVVAGKAGKTGPGQTKPRQGTTSKPAKPRHPF